LHYYLHYDMKCAHLSWWIYKDKESVTLFTEVASIKLYVQFSSYQSEFYNNFVLSGGSSNVGLAVALSVVIVILIIAIAVMYFKRSHSIKEYSVSLPSVSFKDIFSFSSKSYSSSLDNDRKGLVQDNEDDNVEGYQ